MMETWIYLYEEEEEEEDRREIRLVLFPELWKIMIWNLLFWRFDFECWERIIRDNYF